MKPMLLTIATKIGECSMYAVEVVAINRIVSRVFRSLDYDKVLRVFDARKQMRAREVRMVKYTNGRRVVLKYLDRTRRL